MAIDFEKASVAGANTPAEEQGEIIEVKEYE